MFEFYFGNLVDEMKAKYPEKNFLFILDNLHAHKSSLIMKIMNGEDRCKMLFTPSNSPELSPIENMFSQTKKIISKKYLVEKNEYAHEVTKILFGFKEGEIQKFYRRTFKNILGIWGSLNRQQLI